MKCDKERILNGGIRSFFSKKRIKKVFVEVIKL